MEIESHVEIVLPFKNLGQNVLKTMMLDFLLDGTHFAGKFNDTKACPHAIS